MNRTTVAFLVIIVVIVSYLAIHSRKRSPQYWTVDDIGTTRPSLLADSSFAFICALGSGQDGFNVIKVWSDGRCEYTYRIAVTSKAPEWRRGTTTLDPTVVAKLRDLLQAESFLSLKKEYHSNIKDGHQWFFRLDIPNGQKSVYCNNSFPQSLRHIAEFCQTRILGENAKLTTASVPIGDDVGTQWPIP